MGLRLEADQALVRLRPATSAPPMALPLQADQADESLKLAKLLKAAKLLKLAKLLKAAKLLKLAKLLKAAKRLR